MSGTIPDPDDLHTKAATLIEALPYFQRYAGRTFVVKYGGHAMGDEQAAREFASDIVLLKAVGINPVVVHGGGPQIGAMLKKLGVESTFVDGLRVTDKATAEIAEMVLSGAINKQLVGWIARAGGKAIGLSGKDGNLVTATTMAGALAAALGAARLFLLTDVAGVLDKQGDLLTDLDPADIARLREDGTIGGGMIPKLETCVHAVEGGCDAAVVLDGRVAHAMLLEFFTEQGAGTLIRAGVEEVGAAPR